MASPVSATIYKEFIDLQRYTGSPSETSGSIVLSGSLASERLHTNVGMTVGGTVIANTGFMPDANDGAYLGQAGTAFSDLFLASGAVVNFDSGNVTMTHSAGKLDVSATLQAEKLEVAGTGDYVEVDTDLKIISSADVLIDPTGGELKVDGNLVPNSDSADSLGASGTAWANLYVDAIDLNGQGDISLGGTGRIDLDADDDTSIRASADDVIAFEMGGTDYLSFASTNLYGRGAGAYDLGTTALPMGDIFVADDKAIQFGNGQDAKIEYDEDGTDQLRIHQPAAGVVIAGTNPKLVLGDAGAEDTMLVFDGNAQDYRIGLDDGTDTLEFGVGATHGTTTALKIDANQFVTATWFTASYAQVDVLDVNTINSITTTKQSLEILDNTIIAGVSGSSSDADGAGLQIGGYTNNDTVASMKWNDTSKAFHFRTENALRYAMNATGFGPTTNNAGSLGVSGTAWSDLFLATGAVINFNAGNATLTHSNNLLTSNVETRVAKLSIDSANDYIDVDTILKVVAAADILLDPAGGDVKVDGNLSPNADDGGALGAASLNWSDAYFADAAVLNFGDDQDVSLTHVHDTGLLLNSNMQLQFRDSNSYIYSNAANDLEIVATDITLDAATLIDLQSDAVSIGEGGDTDVVLTFNANSNDGVITWMEDEDMFLIDDDVMLRTDEKLGFRDSGIFIQSSADGQLDIAADVELEITAPTVDIDASTEVNISAACKVGGTLSPVSSDGSALGSASLMWSDLFLANGAVINFNNGNVTMTHSAGALTLNSGVNMKAGAFVTYSDERLKENVETLDNALSTIQKLRGVSYDWKKSGQADIGFIAQEVNEVVPALVYGDDKNGYGMDYPSMNALLVEAVKQQQDQIENLKKVVEGLRHKK